MTTYLANPVEANLITLANSVTLDECIEKDQPVLKKLVDANDLHQVARIGAKLLAKLAEVHQVVGDLQYVQFASLSCWIIETFPSWRILDFVNFVKFIGDSQVNPRLRTNKRYDLNYYKMMAGEYNAIREDARHEKKLV